MYDIKEDKKGAAEKIEPLREESLVVDQQEQAEQPVPDEQKAGEAEAAMPSEQADSGQLQPVQAQQQSQEQNASREQDPSREQRTEPSAEAEINTTAVLEAVLFAADEPVSPKKLADIVGTCGVKQIRQHIAELNRKYDDGECAFRIESVAGGYQMLTRAEFNPWLRKLIKVRSETKLSPAAMETLAIIAYKQPIMRVDIEAIRGVAAGEMVRQLIEKGLVKIVGRAEEIGRPLLYGTTKKFLEVFGLNSLKDLPTAEDLKRPRV